MAKGKDQNEDPEEEKNDQFDDDDFGLPDLEYDELEEEADEALLDADDATPDEDSSTESDTPEDIAGDNDTDVAVDEDWEKELEEEIDQDIKDGSFDDATEDFYEEESFEEFDSGVEEESVGSSVFGIDDSAESPSEAPTTKDEFLSPDPSPVMTSSEPVYNQETAGENKGKFVRLVVLGTVLFLVIGAVLYFIWDGSGEGEKKVAKIEKPVKKVEEPVEKPAEPKKEEPKKEEPKAAPKKQPAAANQVTPGEIQSLDERTGKSYVVIGSFFDDDMAMDYAKKLADEGKSPFIIPPFKDHRFYRVAIAEFNSFADANASVEGYKQQYGTEVWPLRY